MFGICRGLRQELCCVSKIFVLKFLLCFKFPEDGFYLGQTLQNIWDDTDDFRIHWLSNEGQKAGIYMRNFPEVTYADCIITHVKPKRIAIDTFQLPDDQREKIASALKKALAKQSGEGDDTDSGEGKRKNNPQERNNLTFFELYQSKI